MKAATLCMAAALIIGTTAAADEREPNKLPDAVAAALEKAEAIEVYSLNGDTNQKEGWHGAKVLGKTTVKKEAEREELVKAVKKAVEDGKDPARCFIPRHGIRVAHDGKTYDLVICFECKWIYIYTEKSDRPQTLLIADSLQKPLNKILKDAKIPLAKEPKEEKQEKD